MRGAPFLLALLLVFGTLPPASAQQAETAPLLNPNPLSGLDLEGLSATRSLPLFTPSRTAPVVEEPVEAVAAPEPPPAVEPEQPPPQLQLVGIVLTESTEIALLLDPGSNEVHRLKTGEDYDGWKLKIVDARSVELRSGERVEGLKMFESFPAPPDVYEDDYDSEMDIQRRNSRDGRIGDPNADDPDFDDPDVDDSEMEESDSDDSGFEDEGFDPDVGQERQSPPAGNFAPELGKAPIPEDGALPADPSGEQPTP